MELRGKLKLPAKICERRDDGWEVSKERDGGLAGGGGGRGRTEVHLNCRPLEMTVEIWGADGGSLSLSILIQMEHCLLVAGCSTEGI